MTIPLEELSLHDNPSFSSVSGTPKDYYRYGSDTSGIPEKKIVGLLACQRDPLLRTLVTRIHSAKPAAIAAPPIQKGKGLKKKDRKSDSSGVSTPVTNESSGVNTPVGNGNGDRTGGDITPSAGRLWEVELLDTVIFPEGGGQPFDTGLLHIPSPSSSSSGEDSIPISLVIEGCLRHKLDSIHLIRVPPQYEPLLESLPGSNQEVTIQVDWERRLDHMSIHTAQHLLSAVLDHYAEGLPTLSWALTANPSIEPPYVELSRGLTWKEVEEVERRCNDLIRENKKVWVDVSLQGGGLGNGDGWDGGESVEDRESRGIPKDYAGGVIRHVNIDQTDRNACCGTQLPYLGMAQHLHIIPPSLTSTSTKPSRAPTKLFFTAGPRATKYLIGASRTLSLTAQALGTNRSDIVSRAENAETGRKESFQRENEVKKLLAKMVAEKAYGDIGDGKGIVWVHKSDKATHDFEFFASLGATFNVLLDEGSKEIGMEKESVVLIMTSAPPGLVPALIQVQGKDDKLVKEVFNGLKSALESVGEKGRVKGGGAKGRYMGKVDGRWGKAEAEKIKVVLEEIREL